MKILVLDRADSWHVNDLKRAATDRHTVDAIGYGEISVAMRVDSGQTSEFRAGSKSVRDFDSILTRAMPASSLEQIVFRMDWLDQVATQHNLLVINPAKTIEASVDKYLSLERLCAAGIPIPGTHVSQTASEALPYFRSSGRDSVVKPIFGSRGRNIIRVTNEREASELFGRLESNGDVIYQQTYIEHGDRDFRFFVIGTKVVSMQRYRPGHWVTNASLGAKCLAHVATSVETDLAIRAARSVGALIAGVDVVYDQSTNPIVVEINACPSWRNISRVSGEDIANEILAEMESILRDC